MTSLLVRYLEDLRGDSRRFDTLPGSLTATIRLDIHTTQGVDKWFLLINKGIVQSSKESTHPDLVMCAPQQLFDDFTCGNSRVMPALFRNAMQIEGDLRLLTIFDRILPVRKMRHHGYGRAEEPGNG
ncbi:SCP2 sterol-binding domain-containing protein [Micromonospora andamanensis]|uniref:SCP2 domain-containing protein n=1 Tax=Micromonospora andamanensis TaxID=1287068 RepID=A0ABQ4I5H8_9ACTN|nr:SCP2 sterol-binding domain-containing protein [Micromonospora andamanensis]GIJ13153.1 hypothetical protein Van01_63670 [Micromonospora andamanensis]